MAGTSAQGAIELLNSMVCADSAFLKRRRARCTCIGYQSVLGQCTSGWRMCPDHNEARSFGSRQVSSPKSPIETSWRWQEKYTFERKLAKGSFGQVFAASDLEVAAGQQRGRPNVAVKVVKASGGDVEAKDLRMLLREIYCLQLLPHPNVLQISDAFITKDRLGVVDLVCLVSPLFDMNLAECVRAQELSPAQRKHILVSVCRGLAYMHRVRIVHRDVKPQNSARPRRAVLCSPSTPLTPWTRRPIPPASCCARVSLPALLYAHPAVARASTSRALRAVLLNADMSACIADLGFARYLPAPSAKPTPRKTLRQRMAAHSLAAALIDGHPDVAEFSDYVVTRWVRAPPLLTDSFSAPAPLPRAPTHTRGCPRSPARARARSTARPRSSSRAPRPTTMPSMRGRSDA